MVDHAGNPVVVSIEQTVEVGGISQRTIQVGFLEPKLKGHGKAYCVQERSADGFVREFQQKKTKGTKTGRRKLITPGVEKIGPG